MASNGAGARTAPAGTAAPVQKSYQAPGVAGSVTARSRTLYAVTGLTISAGPNMYWSSTAVSAPAVGKSITSGRMIVPPSRVTPAASEYT